MDVKSLGDLSREFDGLGLSIEKQLEFLADALEQKIDYDEHEEVSETLFPVVNLLRSIKERTYQDLEVLIEAVMTQERKHEPGAA